MSAEAETIERLAGLSLHQLNAKLDYRFGMTEKWMEKVSEQYTPLLVTVNQQKSEVTESHAKIWEELETAQARTSNLANEIRTGIVVELLQELTPEITLQVAKETAPVSAKLEQLIAETWVAGAKPGTDQQTGTESGTENGTGLGWVKYVFPGPSVFYRTYPGATVTVAKVETTNALGAGAERISGTVLPREWKNGSSDWDCYKPPFTRGNETVAEAEARMSGYAYPHPPHE